MLLREAFNKKEVIKLGSRIKKACPSFNEAEFVNSINNLIDSLNFGDRQRLIIEALEEFLPFDYEKNVNILINSLEPELTKTELTGFDGFMTVPLTKYVAKHGLQNINISMNALYLMTKRNSSEEAIRPFIEKYPGVTLKKLNEWTKDPNPHVRRLCSEGTRPRLPLCSPIKMFKKDPTKVIEILEKLKDDPILLVRRSIANNLNDISKDNPRIVIETLRKWKKEASKERIWIINHALRTLFKNGDKDALAMMGFIEPKNNEISLSINNNISANKPLNGIVSFTSKINQKLMVDYAIHYLKSNGKHSKKVFKLVKKNAKTDEYISCKFSHPFHEMTTRKHYSGEHIVDVIINGTTVISKSFQVIKN